MLLHYYHLSIVDYYSVLLHVLHVVEKDSLPQIRNER